MEVQRYTIMDRLGQWVKYDDIKHLLNVPDRAERPEGAESYPKLSEVLAAIKAAKQYTLIPVLSDGGYTPALRVDYDGGGEYILVNDVIKILSEHFS